MSLSSKGVAKENGWARGIHLASRIEHLEGLGNHRFTAVSILFLISEYVCNVWYKIGC